MLKPDIFAGQRPQIIVSRGIWQIKKTEEKWSLLGGAGECFFHHAVQ